MKEALLKSLVVAAEALKDPIGIDTPQGLHVCNKGDIFIALPTGEMACVPPAFFKAITLPMPGECLKTLRYVEPDGDRPPSV